MTLLSDKDLSLMRATAGAALPDSCVIQGQSFVSDSGGGGTVTWASSGTVDCRIAPLLGFGNSEGETGERLTANSDHIITLPTSASVTTEGRITTGGGTYNVEAIRDRGSWEITQRVEVSKVT